MSTTIQKPPLETHRRFKARVKRSYERRGYQVFTLPHNTRIHLIAIKDGRAELVKCNRSHDIREAEIISLKDIRRMTGCPTWIAYTDRRTPIIIQRPIQIPPQPSTQTPTHS